jgi:hypothetical protein
VCFDRTDRTFHSPAIPRQTPRPAPRRIDLGNWRDKLISPAHVKLQLMRFRCWMGLIPAARCCAMRFAFEYSDMLGSLSICPAQLHWLDMYLNKNDASSWVDGDEALRCLGACFVDSANSQRMRADPIEGGFNEYKRLPYFLTVLDFFGRLLVALTSTEYPNPDHCRSRLLPSFTEELPLPHKLATGRTHLLERFRPRRHSNRSQANAGRSGPYNEGSALLSLLRNPRLYLLHLIGEGRLLEKAHPPACQAPPRGFHE